MPGSRHGFGDTDREIADGSCAGTAGPYPDTARRREGTRRKAESVCSPPLIIALRASLLLVYAAAIAGGGSRRAPRCSPARATSGAPRSSDDDGAVDPLAKPSLPAFCSLLCKRRFVSDDSAARNGRTASVSASECRVVQPAGGESVGVAPHRRCTVRNGAGLRPALKVKVWAAQPAPRTSVPLPPSVVWPRALKRVPLRREMQPHRAALKSSPPHASRRAAANARAAPRSHRARWPSAPYIHTPRAWPFMLSMQ